MDKQALRLEGKTIYLRFLRLEDATPAYLSWLEDPDVMQGIATSGYTIGKLRDYIGERLQNPHTAFFAICDLATYTHIGNVKIDFHDAKANVSELGLLIGNKAYWSRGIGHEACRLAIEYGFREMHLRKIYLAVYENNPNAKRLYEKLGFTLEGTLRKHVAVNGTYYDKYLMGLFNHEWQ